MGGGGGGRTGVGGGCNFKQETLCTDSWGQGTCGVGGVGSMAMRCALFRWDRSEKKKNSLCTSKHNRWIYVQPVCRDIIVCQFGRGARGMWGGREGEEKQNNAPKHTDERHTKIYIYLEREGEREREFRLVCCFFIHQTALHSKHRASHHHIDVSTPIIKTTQSNLRVASSRPYNYKTLQMVNSIARPVGLRWLP